MTTPGDLPEVAKEQRRVDTVFQIASGVGGEGFVARTEADMILGMVHASFVRSAVTSLARHLSRSPTLFSEETMSAINACLLPSSMRVGGLKKLQQRLVHDGADSQ